MSDESTSQHDDPQPEQDEGGTPATKARTLVVVAIAAGVAILILVGAIAMRPSGDKRPAIPVFADAGEAPAGKQTDYVSVPGAPEPASVGRFSNEAGDGGPLHRDAGVVFLGTSPGRDLNSGSQQDSTQSISTGDDGLVIPWGYATADPTGVTNGLAPCTDNRILVAVDASRIPDSLVGQTAYVNLFFDWDRNGKYEKGDGCGEEWSAKNVPIKLDRKEGMTLPVVIRAGRQTMDFWHRSVISVEEELSSGTPGSSLKFGETEDAHWVDPGIRNLAEAKPPENPDACADAPTTVVKSKTRSLIKAASGPPASRPSVDFPSVHGVGESGSDARIVDFRSTLGVAPARSSAWLELALGERGGVSRGRIEFEIKGKRIGCNYLQLGEDALSGGDLGPVGTPVLPSGDSGAKPTLSGLYCPHVEVNGGESTLVNMQDFGGGLRRDNSYTVISQPSDSSATAEGTRVVVDSAIPPKSAASTWQVQVAGGAEEKSITCSTTVTGKLPPRSQKGVAPPTSGGKEPQPTMVSFGSYKIRFAKKTDSCGNYPLRQEETVQVRPAPKNQIEFHRPATGNKSLGNLNTSDSSFLATGSGVRKDGRNYVEQYLGKFNGLNVSGSYELQEGECRATFTFEGSRA